MKISPRHLVWVNLVLLALVAYFGAATINGALAARLTPPLTLQLRPAPPPIERESNRPESYYHPIAKRDIFNAVQPVVEKPPEPPKQTELRLKLWGVMVNETSPGFSYGIIENLVDRKTEPYQVGEEVGGVATVKRVEWEQIVLDRGGAEEILKLEQPAPSGGAVPLPAVAAAASGAGGGANPRPAKGGGAKKDKDDNKQTASNDTGTIQQTGDGEYTIAQTEIDSALDNMNQLFTQIRAVPHFQGGKSTGFRMFAIRQDSIFDKIGLRNGDIIHSVNGTDISDPGQALALFQNLRGQSQYKVEITRNKEPKSLNYQVR